MSLIEATSALLHRHRYGTLSLLLVGLYGFVLSLTGFKEAWALAFSVESSGDFVQGILDASLATPFTSLLSGIIITSLVQSSSATIALVVATVAAGAVSVADSVFVLMGANIGTTVTNTIVGLAHGHKREEFDRLVPAILVDDVFKVFNVAIFFSIESLTGVLHNLSVSIVDYLSHVGVIGGFLEGFPDLIDVVTEPTTAFLISLVAMLPVGIGWQSFLVGLGFFLLLILSLSLMGEALEIFLHDRSRKMVASVFGGKLQAFAIGFGICWLLQSSSVAVSLILPLVGQLAVTLPTVYHYSIGAALATTCDPGQLLSYLKFGPIGLSAGMVHILLNVFGALLFLMIPGLNRLPILLAEWLSDRICRYQHAPLWLTAYVGVLFFGMPLAVISMVGWLG